METVLFLKESIMDYLDKCIINWEKVRDNPNVGHEINQMAIHYIDAYQSVRVSLFGETLK